MDQLFTISAFTENSPGVLHRITAMFTRRKINIETLTVSETEQPGISRFTIAVRSDAETVRKIVPQIRRIIEVRDAYSSEDSELVVKEIAFIRVATIAPSARLQIEEAAERHSASVVYADKDSVIVEKTGVEEEIRSLLLLLEPFGIKEFIRSGRIALRKSPKIESVSAPEITEEVGDYAP